MGDQDRRNGLSAACGVLAALTAAGALAVWAEASSQGAHVPIWPAFPLGAVAVIALYMTFASVFGLWPTRTLPGPRQHTPLPPPADGAPELPPPPLCISVVPDEPDGERQRLVVTNDGVRGTFTGEVTGILGPDGRPAPAPRSWPVPWLENGSIGPAEIPQHSSRRLDFARLNAGESDPWPHQAYWQFPTPPKPHSVMYAPGLTWEEIEAQRFMVTVRIIRAEPAADPVDRQFSIGVTSDSRLVCEPVPDGALSSGAEASPGPLAQVRSLLEEGRSLQGSLASHTPMGTMLPGLPDRVEGWEMTVGAALESSPDLCARFDGGQFAVTQSAVDSLVNRLAARLGVLEAIRQELTEAEG